MANYSTIRYEKKGQIARIVLNRPQAANAVSRQMAAEVGEVCCDVNQDDSLRAVIITGAGETFCSGEEQDCALDTILAEEVARIEWPVIAAINGDALGTGLALALACDIRIASERALLGVPDPPQGHLPASGITQWLPRTIGKGKAMEMLLLGEPIDAQEAYRIGLIHKVLPPDGVLPEAEKLAGEMVPKAPLALKYAKEAVHKGLDLTLEQGMRLECDLYMILQTTADRTEGIKSFQEKRSPQFKGE